MLCVDVRLSPWQKWAQQLVSRHAFGHGAEPVCWQQWTHRQMREEGCQTITWKRFWLCLSSVPPTSLPTPPIVKFSTQFSSAGNDHAPDSSFKPLCLVEVMVSFSQEKREKKKQCPGEVLEFFSEETDSVCGAWQPQGSPQSCSVSDPLLWKVLRWLGEDVKAYGKGGTAKNYPSQRVVHLYCRLILKLYKQEKK